MMDRAAAAQHSFSHCPDSSHPGDITFHGMVTRQSVRRVTSLNSLGAGKLVKLEIKCRRGIEYVMSTRTCHHYHHYQNCHQALFMDPMYVPIIPIPTAAICALQSYYYYPIMFIVYCEIVMRPHKRDIKAGDGCVTKVQCLVLTSTTPPPARPR